MNRNVAPVEYAESDAIALKYGVSTRLGNSAFVPGFGLRDMHVATSTSGGYLVSSADLLRIGVPGASNSFLNLCTVITPDGRTGAQRIGKFTELPAVTVLANETATATEVSPPTAQSLLSPSSATSYVEQSRHIVLQSEGGAAATAGLLTNALRTHVGAQILMGAGTGGEVLGLANDSAIATGTGSALAWGSVCTTMETVEKAAGDGALAWVVTAPAATIMRQRGIVDDDDAALGSGPILRDGSIGGYPCIVIGGTTAAAAAFGRWSDLIVYQWLPLEIAVNPFANFKSGIIGVRGWIAFNAAPLVASSFATITDIS
jgi:HK97 family phage major capsid protein